MALEIQVLAWDRHAKCDWIKSARSQSSCWYLDFQKTKTTCFPLINPTTLLMYIEFSAIIKKRSR